MFPSVEAALVTVARASAASATRWQRADCVRDLAHAESAWPGWLAKLLTHPVRGLENWREVFAKLHDAKGAIKVFCEVAPL